MNNIAFSKQRTCQNPERFLYPCLEVRFCFRQSHLLHRKRLMKCFPSPIHTPTTSKHFVSSILNRLFEYRVHANNYLKIVIFFSKYHVVMPYNGGQNVARRSKKDKAAGREKHRQLIKAKKMQKKQKKKVELPTRHRKGKK